MLFETLKLKMLNFVFSIMEKHLELLKTYKKLLVKNFTILYLMEKGDIEKDRKEIKEIKEKTEKFLKEVFPEDLTQGKFYRIKKKLEVIASGVSKDKELKELKENPKDKEEEIVQKAIILLEKYNKCFEFDYFGVAYQIVGKAEKLLEEEKSND